MTSKLEQEEYLYRRAIDIIESADSDKDKEDLLFQEVWIPLAELYKERIVGPEGWFIYISPGLEWLSVIPAYRKRCISFEYGAYSLRDSCSSGFLGLRLMII